MKVTIIQPKTENSLLKKRVCAYARVSSLSNSQGESLENQITYFKSKIKSNPEYEFVDVFVDHGITGTKEDRPAFQEMLKQCQEGKIDLILVKSVSRFARNTLIVLEQVRKLKSMGVEVYFENDNIRTLSKDGELMLTVLSAFAEEESRSVSENVKWSIRKRFEKGEGILNTKRFLGYDKDMYGDLIINEKEAEIVRRIFEEYLNGKGSHAIAKLLNAEGVPTVAGGKWHDTTILGILKNEKYKGDALLQKTYTPDYRTKKKKRNNGNVNTYLVRESHSPIISDDRWEEVQKELQRRRRSIDLKKNKYALSGKLICSKCGSKLKRRTWNSGKPSQKIVWQCSTYIKEGKNVCEGTVIDDALITALNIEEETVIKEWVVNGEKRYLYTSKADDSN